MGINHWLVSGTEKGIELTQKKCPAVFYQRGKRNI